MFGINLRRAAVLEEPGGVAKSSRCQETKSLEMLCLSSPCIRHLTQETKLLEMLCLSSPCIRHLCRVSQLIEDLYIL